MVKTWISAVIATSLVVAMVVIVGLTHEEHGTIQGILTLTFSHYISEEYESTVQGHGQHSRRVVFDENHAYCEGAYLNDASYSYDYYNGGDYSGKCERVGDHHNCYVLSGAIETSVVVPKISILGTLVDCPAIRDPILGGSKRNLSKCYHFYREIRDSKKNIHKIDYWVELETNYPVREWDRTEKTDGRVSYTMRDYCTFEETVPSDRTKLGPIAGVKVYDLRNGKEGLFTGSEDETQMDESNEEEKENDMKQLRRESFFNERQVRGFHGFIGPSMGPAPVHTMTARDVIPESFDARDKWPQCGVINEIKSQGKCGCCWAMASSSALADRVCIYTNGATNVSLSPQFMVNCLPNNNGCHGGFDEPMWKDLMEIGTVPESCLPFQHQDQTCTGRCENGNPMPQYTKTKNFYSPWGETDKARVEAIQREIMEHGPVSASFWVFSDWEKYWNWPNPIYHRSLTAKFSSGHVVRIIGWGTENGEDYWLIANSHGTDFREGGFFKMRRGNNECNIEETVVAGEPLIE